MDFSDRIRSLRRLQRRTLKDVARQGGFSVSLLSKIESGKTTPPLGTLGKIAAALGVGLSDLLGEGLPKGTVLTTARQRETRGLTRTDKGYAFHLLASERADKAMQPFVFEAKKDEVAPGPMSHPGEEFVFVLEGQMEYRVGDVTYLLAPGDSLYFDAEQDHDLKPVTDTVRYLDVFTARPAERDRDLIQPTS